jgi:hypothetical protein
MGPGSVGAEREQKPRLAPRDDAKITSFFFKIGTKKDGSGEPSHGKLFDRSYVLFVTDSKSLTIWRMQCVFSYFSRIRSRAVTPRWR